MSRCSRHRNSSPGADSSLYAARGLGARAQASRVGQVARAACIARIERVADPSIERIARRARGDPRRWCGLSPACGGAHPHRRCWARRSRSPAHRPLRASRVPPWPRRGTPSDRVPARAGHLRRRRSPKALPSRRSVGHWWGGRYRTATPGTGLDPPCRARRRRPDLRCVAAPGRCDHRRPAGEARVLRLRDVRRRRDRQRHGALLHGCARRSERGAHGSALRGQADRQGAAVLGLHRRDGPHRPARLGLGSGARRQQRGAVSRLERLHTAWRHRTAPALPAFDGPHDADRRGERRELGVRPGSLDDHRGLGPHHAVGAALVAAQLGRSQRSERQLLHAPVLADLRRRVDVLCISAGNRSERLRRRQRRTGGRGSRLPAPTR